MPNASEVFSLGWELETTGYRPNHYLLPEEVREDSDGSVGGAGREYVIKERFVHDPMNGIKVLRSFLKQEWITVDKSCGFHVHLGLKQYDEAYQRLWGAWLVNLAKHIERSAFDAVPASRRNNRYCRAWKNVMLPDGIMKQHYSSSKHSNEHRYHWLNITEMFRDGGIRTAEIRLMGQERRFSVLYAWIACAFKMGTSALRLVEDPSLMAQEVAILDASFERMKKVRTMPSLPSLKEAMTLGQEAGIPLRLPVVKRDSGNPYRFDSKILMGLTGEAQDHATGENHYVGGCSDDCDYYDNDERNCLDHREELDRPVVNCDCYLCEFHRARAGNFAFNSGMRTLWQHLILEETAQRLQRSQTVAF